MPPEPIPEGVKKKHKKNRPSIASCTHLCRSGQSQRPPPPPSFTPSHPRSVPPSTPFRIPPLINSRQSLQAIFPLCVYLCTYLCAPKTWGSASHPPIPSGHIIPPPLPPHLTPVPSAPTHSPLQPPSPSPSHPSRFVAPGEGRQTCTCTTPRPTLALYRKCVQTLRIGALRHYFCVVFIKTRFILFFSFVLSQLVLAFPSSSLHRHTETHT